MIGRLLYKCRRCGVVDSHHALANVCNLLVRTVMETGEQARLVGIHECNDGVIGISDLIGGVEDEKKAEPG